jgi:phosphate transport system substrate-binding protein
MTSISSRVRMSFALPTFAVLWLVAFEVQAQQPVTPRPLRGKLTVTGASSLFPLVNDMARRFEALNPGVKIDVRSVGSGKGMTDLRAGTSDIAMLSRTLIQSERDLFSFPIARDGVAAVVHRDNPVKSLDTRQLTELLTDQVVNWKTLGGRDMPVNLAWRKGHGSFELMLERLNLKREQIGKHLSTIASEDAIKFAATHPNGITLASVGASERSAHAGVAIKLLAYNGVPASSRTIQNHSYMLSRPLTLVTRNLPQGVQKQFIDYALSSQVVDLQLKYGFVPYQE